jgi:hypothetical protein
MLDSFDYSRLYCCRVKELGPAGPSDGAAPPRAVNASYPSAGALSPANSDLHLLINGNVSCC